MQQEEANPKVGGANLLLGKVFPENWMKLKETGPRSGHVPSAPSLDPPMVRYLFMRQIFNEI